MYMCWLIGLRYYEKVLENHFDYWIGGPDHCDGNALGFLRTDSVYNSLWISGRESAGKNEIRYESRINETSPEDVRKVY